MSAQGPQPGRPGNLTEEQEEKLCEFWAALLKLCGITDAAGATDAEPPSAPTPTSSKSEAAIVDEGQKQKKKRMGLFSRKQSDGKKGDSKAAASASDTALNADDPEDKYGQTKQFYETLATMTPDQLHDTVWSMVKHDHPDALCLRFLRARKWDVQKALIMMISTMNWRSTQMQVDSDIMKNGEAGALADLQSDDVKTKKVAVDFLQQMRQGKTLIHGVDKKGSPVCIVRVRLHKVGEQSEEGLERYTVYLIETARMMLRPPVDTATMVFDMSGFSMANMDYTPVKFIIKCFEANYPESLASVLVHKAPWVFQGIWKMIRGWLDPVVANKITFTNNLKELEEYLPADKIPKELDGPEEWEYQYVEPAPGENDRMKDTATRDRLQAARTALVQDYVKATLEWVRAGSDQTKAAAIKKQREDIAVKLRASYWELDPYVRARSLFDRVGIMQGEKMDFYPPKNTTTAKAPKAETSADDLD